MEYSGTPGFAGHRTAAAVAGRLRLPGLGSAGLVGGKILAGGQTG
ncbi:MAG: hypothetical protein JWO38_5504 [Gemmataceae bacterium]|nr:hypothetical protein [Gemmataceae bacterium]